MRGADIQAGSVLYATPYPWPPQANPFGHFSTEISGGYRFSQAYIQKTPPGRPENFLVSGSANPDFPSSLSEAN